MTSFVDVREPHTNKLLLRYDPDRLLVEVQQRGVKTVIDLTQIKSRRVLCGAQNDLTAANVSAMLTTTK